MGNMDELQSLSLKIAELKKHGRKTIPLALKEQILRAVEMSNLHLDKAADILNLHPMTFYKWKRSLKRKPEEEARRVGKSDISISKKSSRAFSKKHRHGKGDAFIELLPPAALSSSVTAMAVPSSKTTNQVLLEIDLGHGTLLRIYR